jgi:hypothetical protein
MYFSVLKSSEILGSHGGKSGLLRRVVWKEFIDVSEVFAVTIVMVMS